MVFGSVGFAAVRAIRVAFREQVGRHPGRARSGDGPAQ